MDGVILEDASKVDSIIAGLEENQIGLHAGAVSGSLFACNA